MISEFIFNNIIPYNYHLKGISDEKFDAFNEPSRSSGKRNELKRVKQNQKNRREIIAIIKRNHLSQFQKDAYLTDRNL